MKKIILVDIDGTVSNPHHRVHYLLQEKKDWDSFYAECDKDIPIKPILDLISKLNYYSNIVFCTGRRNSERQKTLDWLATHFDLIDTDNLLMRKDGDHRHDTDVKPELLQAYFDKNHLSNEAVSFILEDRSTMVKKWRELGFTCLQVADGDF